MTRPAPIPVFTLFGETDPFPEPVHCEAFSARAPIHGWSISPHRHAKMAQLFLIARGRVDARIDGAAQRLADGDFLFVPARAVHSFRFEPDTEGRVLSFPISVVETIGPAREDVAQALSRPVSGPAEPRLVALADLLSEAVESHRPLRAQMSVALAHAVLSHLAEAALGQSRDKEPPGSAALARLDALIGRQMAEGWRASDYAAAMNISTGHLSRLCREAAGMGATAYLERSVMEEACRLLAFTRVPVAEIGYRLGFADPSYFSRRFRKLHGQSPRDYRRRFTV